MPVKKSAAKKKEKPVIEIENFTPIAFAPSRYEILNIARSHKHIKEGVPNIIKVIAVSHSIIHKISRNTPYTITCLIVDEYNNPSNTQINLIFFAGSPSWWGKAYPLQKIIVIIGKTKVFKDNISIVHPQKSNHFDVFDQNQNIIIKPIYKKFGHKISDATLQQRLLEKVQNLSVPCQTHIQFESWPMYVRFLVEFYGTNSIKKIAVTGTNGKTSTVHFCASIASFAGVKCASIGTNGVCIYEKGGITSQVSTGLTTATCTQNHGIIHNLHKDGIQCLFMEASSIGIEQGRLDGITFDVSCFTNLSQDHLDYHKTMEEYLRQKMRLFLEFTRKNGTVVLNKDDNACQKIATNIKEKIVFYGTNTGVIQSYTETKDGIALVINNEIVQFYAHGNFQVLNLECSIQALLSVGMKIEDIVRQIPKLQPPLGRMQAIQMHGITVIVDYAHTPDALQNVLQSIQGKKTVVFGCGGNRDKAKRPIMGKIATENANYTILTSDNPRLENPQDIIHDITLGITTKNFEIIVDRTQAIHKALSLASKGSYVIIAGKGSESYQEINGIKTPFSDVDAVKSFKLTKAKKA